MRNKISAVICLALWSLPAWARVTVLVDHVGYESLTSKRALIVGAAGDHPRRFSLIDSTTGKSVLAGDLAPSGEVKNWKGFVFWTADFSSIQKTGHYELTVDTDAGPAHSCSFAIDDDLLERSTLSNILYYFKGQRSSGLIDRADRRLALPEGQSGFVDVHGGWYDATGDYGIHLSHQNLTSYFNPQQVPLVAWTLLKSYRVLEARKEDNFTEYQRRMLDEALFGVDYLVRIKRPSGSFYESISGPGRRKLPQDRVIGNPNWRTQIKTKATDTTEQLRSATGPHSYEAGFRSGAGMAIASLALASSMPGEGDFTRADYLHTAEQAFDFLTIHNSELLNDGTENMLDDYCALLAATELYRASHEDRYRKAADTRASNLMARLIITGPHHGYWRADGGTRPFFHPSDAGLPVVSLLEYFSIASAAVQNRFVKL